MPYPILGTPKPAFFDSSGAPLASGTLSILNPDDDTNKASYPTYDDAAVPQTPNSNPITLDSRGETTTELWGLDNEDYKLVLKDSDSNTIWTILKTLTATTATYVSGLYLPLAGGTMTGAIVTPPLTDYSITSTSPSILTNTLTLDIENGNSFEVSLTENITSITISNPTASGEFCEVIVKFTQDSTGSRTVTGWPTTKWPEGIEPVVTTTATTGVTIVALKTWNGGTTWYGDYSLDCR